MSNTGRSGSRRRLGRGLSDLVRSEPVRVDSGAHEKADAPSAAPSEPTEAAPNPDRAAGTVWIEVGRIRPSRDQARSVFDDEALDALAESIREQGLMQPVVVRKASDDNGFELVAGERRWRAAQRCGLERVPAVVRELSDEQAAQLGLIENIQREDLNAVDRARGFANLRDRYGWTQETIASRVGLNRSSVSNQMRLLELDEEILALIQDGTLDAGHGKALLSAPEGARAGLAERAAGEGWSVRETERAAKAPNGEGGGSEEGSTGSASAVAKAPPNPVIADVERRLREALGTRVRVRARGTTGKGALEIEYYDLDHFEGLLSRMGVSLERG